MFDGTVRIGLEVFLFALLVFGMVLIVTFMVLHSRQKQAAMTQKDWEQKEEKLMLLYFEVEDMISGLKEYVENARSVIELEYDRARAEANGLELGKVLKETRAAAPEPAPVVPLEPAVEVEIGAGSAGRNALHEQVLELARQNKTAAEIAEEVQLSKSEVRLILRLGH